MNLGLGEKTGANVPYEFQGKLPEMKPGFVERRMFSYADGFEVTPLQLGTLVSAMANGGKLLVPRSRASSKEQSKVGTKGPSPTSDRYGYLAAHGARDGWRSELRFRSSRL